MIRQVWTLVLVGSLAVPSSAARAAVPLSPGEELIYTGTAVWKQSVSGGPPEIFRGRVRIAALVTRAEAFAPPPAATPEPVSAKTKFVSSPVASGLLGRREQVQSQTRSIVPASSLAP